MSPCGHGCSIPPKIQVSATRVEMDSQTDDWFPPVTVTLTNRTQCTYATHAHVCAYVALIRGHELSQSLGIRKHACGCEHMSFAYLCIHRHNYICINHACMCGFDAVAFCFFSSLFCFFTYFDLYMASFCLQLYSPHNFANLLQVTATFRGVSIKFAFNLAAEVLICSHNVSGLDLTFKNMKKYSNKRGITC